MDGLNNVCHKISVIVDKYLHCSLNMSASKSTRSCEPENEMLLCEVLDVLFFLLIYESK